jgi:hypothetical protein
MSEPFSQPAPAAAVPPPRAWRILLPAGIAAALVVFVAQSIYFLNLFYFFGASEDGSLLSNVIWHGDWQLMPPPWYSRCTFLSFHFTPVFYPLMALSYVVPGHPVVEYYTAFIACTYALLAVAMYRALVVCLAPSRLGQTLGLAVVAILFAFNGVVVQALWVEHFEYAIPACIILFLVEFKRGNLRWALIWLVLLLSVREDAGFHLAGVLILLAVLDWWRARTFAAAKADLAFAAAATAYSVMAWWMASHLRALCGGHTQFRAVYTGIPAYAHLSWQLLGERAFAILRDSLYLPLSAVVTLAWALYRRNLYLLVGFAAFIPWFLLSWTAASAGAGMLEGYYAFPFMVGMGWPIVAVLCKYGKDALPRSAVREALVLQTVVVLIGLVMWSKEDARFHLAPEIWAKWSSYSPLWIQLVDGRRTDIRPRVHELAAEIGQNPALGRVAADFGVLAFTFETAPEITSVVRINSPLGVPVDTVAYVCVYGGYPSAEVVKAASKSGLTRNYRAYPTDVCLVTNRTQEELGQFGRSLQAKPFDTSALAAH